MNWLVRHSEDIYSSIITEVNETYGDDIRALLKDVKKSMDEAKDAESTYKQLLSEGNEEEALKYFDDNFGEPTGIVIEKYHDMKSVISRLLGTLRAVTDAIARNYPQLASTEFDNAMTLVAKSFLSEFGDPLLTNYIMVSLKGEGLPTKVSNYLLRKDK